ncbi:hypothetical protein D7B24_005111 [Verticillium nonalfalfae]|uniref:FHA domain-containing protein n=1 Tax=Verticillium nonalfalfae TaxID=1051616 RepID=A0A3M9YEE3_9PEZI|nr:uncharacterized protein D7B24_005111 [Verticillium nonalfalfae]RNJ58156.1 hypothetical protein D7B24_005111 [Verticillium nonalfalfae]
MSDDRMSSTDDVIVSLSFPISDNAYPERRITLNAARPSIQVGRTSKRVANLSAALDNAWLENPVISREHAEIFLGPDTEKAVYIKDRNSRHGTFVNKDRVYPHTPVQLHQGDFVRFGIDIQRDQGLYPPPSASIDIQFINGADHNTTGTHTPVDRSVGYHVPETSDDSDGFDSDDCDDEDCNAVRSAVANLRAAGEQRAPKQDTAAITPTTPAVTPGAAPSKISISAEIIDLDHYEPKGETVIDLTGPSASEQLPTVSKPAPCVTEVLDFDCDDEDKEDVHLSMEPEPTYSVDHSHQPIHFDTSESEHESSNDDTQLDGAPLGVWSSSVIAGTEHTGDDDEDDFEIESSDSISSEDESISDIDEYEDNYEEASIAMEDAAKTQSPLSSGWGGYPELSQSVKECNELGFLPAIGSEKPQVPTSPPEQQWMLPPLQQVLGSNGMTMSTLPTMIPAAPQCTIFVSASATNSQSIQKSRKLPPWREAAANLQPDRPGQSFNTWRSENEDFLQARESNKQELRRRLSVSKTELPKSSVTLLSTPTTEPALSGNLKSENESTAACEPVIPTDDTEDSLDLAPCSKNLLVQSSPPAEAVWIDSGDRFLTGPVNDPVIADARISPELDMTSAWSFNQSKMATATVEPDSNIQASMVELQLIGAPVKICEQLRSRTSAKRKASDISDAVLGEEAVEAALNDTTNGDDLAARAPSAYMGRGDPAVSASSETSKSKQRCSFGVHEHGCDRPSKRFRRMAEAASLVALGGAAAGVAFITTLIATAPAL